MSELQNLYQELIIDHGKHPRNCGTIENADHMQVGNNPLCGDKLVLYIKETNGVIDDIKFKGEGCAIAMASTSLMTEKLKGKTVEEAKRLFHSFHQLVAEEGEVDARDLGKLQALAGVKAFPVRVKCATLPWQTLSSALDGGDSQVSTE